MRQLLLILSVLFLSTACSNFHMEKRRYNKGFHISFNKNRLKEKADSKEKEIASKNRSSDKSSEIKSVKNPEITFTESHTAITTTTEGETNDPAEINVSTSESRLIPSVVQLEDATTQASQQTATISDSKRTASTPTEKSGASALWYFALLGIVPVLFATKQSSRNISLWASENVSKAQVAIAGLYALGASSSFLLGNIWQPVMEEWMLIVPMTLAGSVLVADAAKKEGKSGFLRNKMSSAVVNVSSFFGTFAMGAQSKIGALQLMDPEAQTGMEPWAATLVTLLIVTFMVIAFLGIALLACELSCSGYGVLALFVLAGGLFLILFLGIWGILTAFRGRSRNRDNLKVGLITGLAAALLILIPAGIAYLIGF